MNRVLISLVSLWPLSAASAELVEIVEPSGFHGNVDIYINGDYGAKIGEAIALEEGIFKVKYASKYGYDLTFTIDVSENSISADDFDAFRFGDCIGGKISPYEIQNWPGANIVERGSNEAKLHSVILFPPKYRHRGEDPGGCGSYSSLQTLRTLGKATLEISSSPTGATIYIEGKKVGGTNARKIVPYKEYNKNMRVVLKLNGHANCIRDITLVEGDFGEKVQCTMKPLPDVQ